MNLSSKKISLYSSSNHNSSSIKKQHFSANSNSLRKGFTTGAAATAAARAALKSLIHGSCPEIITVKTLNNNYLNIYVNCAMSTSPSKSGGIFHCGVIKDGGDDPDVTNNLLIMATVELTSEPGNVKIDGSQGVGTVTKPGLPVKIGKKAINPGPRKMITDNLVDVLPKQRGVKVTIWVPSGKSAAKKTLNDKLGINNGISILGTTGIVDPLSTEAYKESLYLQLHQIKALKLKTAVLTPGKIGEKNASNLNIPGENVAFIGNYVGDMLISAAKILEKNTDILIFGHVGKLCKVAAGVFQTHNKIADARREVFITHCALQGFELKILGQIYNANTTEEIISYLKTYSEQQKNDSHIKVFESIATKISSESYNFIDKQLHVGTILTDRSGNILAADKVALNICKKEGWNL